MLQIAQSSMNDPRGPAGRPGSKIMLLDKKRPFTAAGTLARDSGSVNSAANHDYLKPLPFQRRSSFRIDFHMPTEPLRTENWQPSRSEEHTSELQSQSNLVCRLLL